MKEGGKFKVRKGDMTREPKVGVVHRQNGGRGHDARTADGIQDGKGQEADPPLQPLEGTQTF